MFKRVLLLSAISLISIYASSYDYDDCDDHIHRLQRRTSPMQPGLAGSLPGSKVNRTDSMGSFPRAGYAPVHHTSPAGSLDSRNGASSSTTNNHSSLSGYVYSEENAPTELGRGNNSLIQALLHSRRENEKVVRSSGMGHPTVMPKYVEITGSVVHITSGTEHEHQNLLRTESDDGSSDSGSDAELPRSDSNAELPRSDSNAEGYLGSPTSTFHPASNFFDVE